MKAIGLAVSWVFAISIYLCTVNCCDVKNGVILNGKSSNRSIFCATECTLLMIKPDGVQRGYVGKIITRFESKGFKLIEMKLLLAEESLLKNHYSEHEGKVFFPNLISYMSSGPVIPMVWEGFNIIKESRKMIGPTDPSAATPGTIRGDWCTTKEQNMIHGSDSICSSHREIKLWFPEFSFDQARNCTDS